jgi:hypothetical protein
MLLPVWNEKSRKKLAGSETQYLEKIVGYAKKGV